MSRYPSVRRTTAVALAVPLFLLATACQASVGSTPAVSKSDVADQVRTSLTANGLTITDVSCADDLQGKVDASVTCAVTLDDGTTQDVKATVTSMDGTTAKFDVAPVDPASGSATP